MIRLTLIAWLIIFLDGCTRTHPQTLQAVDININLAITYLQQGNREKARFLLNRAVAAQPKSAMAWSSLAYLEELSHNLLLAQQYYQYAIKLAPTLGETHNNYGAYLCRHHQYQTGIYQFVLAAQSPSYIFPAAAWENAGLCALMAADKQAAKRYFQTALNNDPHRSLSQSKLKQLDEK